jgi:choline-glycine betaine transporter
MGRIAYGRTVRQTLGLYIGLCSMVSALWMTIVSGTAINFQMKGVVDLVKG